MTADSPTGNGIAHWLRMASILISILTGFSVLFGVFHSMHRTGVVERIVFAVGTGLIAGCTLGLGWHMLIKFAETSRKAVLAMLTGVALVSVAIGLNTWFLAAAIGGEDAVRESKIAYIRGLQASERRIMQNARNDAEFLSALKSAQVEVGRMAVAENLSGHVSGLSAGRDGWTINLEGAASSLANSGQEIESLVARRQQLLAAARRSLATLQEAAVASDDAAFRKIALRVAGVLAEAGELKGIEGVAGLGSGLMGKEASGEIGGVFSRLAHMAEAAEDRWIDADVPLFHPISRYIAVIEYGYSVPGAWVVGLSLEIIPLILLFLLVSKGHLALRGDDA